MKSVSYTHLDVYKRQLLDCDILDALIPMTYSSNQEVSGNAAAALANLCSRINNYSKIIEAWESPNEGIRGFLIRFLQSEYPTFEHIALWTILQLLESHNDTVLQLIKENKEIVKSIKSLSDTNYESAQRASTAMNSNSMTNSGSSEQYDDASLELYNITQQIIQFLN